MAVGNTGKIVKSFRDISDEEIRQTFTFLPHIIKIVRAASTSSATEPLLLKNSIQELKDQLMKAHGLIERADFLNITPMQQNDILKNLQAKVIEREELMKKYAAVDYNTLMHTPVTKDL